MRKLLFILFLNLAIAPVYINSADAQSIDSTHIICAERTQDILGLLNLDCKISAEDIKSDPVYQVQISYDGKIWKDVQDTRPHLYRDWQECISNEGQQIAPLSNPKSPQCFEFNLMYEPGKAGKFSLRLHAFLENSEYVSNSVPFEATEELIAEQAESRAIDARNRSYSLTVKWPYKISVGVPHTLFVTSKDKYSGYCTIRSVIGSPISIQNFTIKNGAGRVSLRGLKIGNAHVNISCKQASGSGPYASSFADVYFY